MMTKDNDAIIALRDAAAKRVTARTRFNAELNNTKVRLHPTQLIENAKKSMIIKARAGGEKAVVHAKRNSPLLIALGTAATAFALRKPLLGLIKKTRNRYQRKDVEM